MSPLDRAGQEQRGLERLESAFQTDDAEMRHPAFEELKTLADGRADAARRESLALHFSQCAVCESEYHDLAEFREGLLPVRRLRRVLPMSAVAAAFAILLVIVFARSRPASEGSGVPNARTHRLLVSLKDGSRSIGLDEGGAVQGLDGIRASDRELLRAALKTGALPLSKQAGDLRRSREVLLGEGGAPETGFQFLTPVGTVVPENEPRFKWAAPAGASQFIVSVYTTGFDLVQESPKLNGSEWNPSHSLADGRTFLWTVSAVVQGKRVTAPRSPEPEVRFRIATAEERRELDSATTAAPDSALLRAVVAARLGMRAAADEALLRLASDNPGSALLPSMKASLR